MWQAGKNIKRVSEKKKKKKKVDNQPVPDERGAVLVVSPRAHVWGVLVHDVESHGRPTK